MASPERSNPAPKSPFSEDAHIFSDLSPIKPSNAMQAYENIDVPSPQLVFKTPNFSRSRSLNVMERYQHPALSAAGNISPGYASNATKYPDTGKTIFLPMAQLISCTEKNCNGGGPSPDQNYISPSSCMDSFLASTSDISDDLSGSPGFFVNRGTKNKLGDTTSTSGSEMNCCKEDLAKGHSCTSSVSVIRLIQPRHSNRAATALPQTSQNDSIGTEETTTEIHVPNYKTCIASKVELSSIKSYQVEEDLGSVSVSDEIMVSDEITGISKTSIDEDLGPLPKNVSINNDSFIVPVSSTLHENNSVDQHATDHPLMSEPEDLDITAHDKENSTASGFVINAAEGVKTRSAETGQSDDLDFTTQLRQGSPQNILAGGGYSNDSTQLSSFSTGDKISSVQEGGGQHQSRKRKRLFEAGITEDGNRRKNIGNRNSCIYTTDDCNVDIPIIPLDMDTVNVSHAESVRISGNKQVIQSVRRNVMHKLPVKVDKSAQHTGISHVVAPMPSGIGLHLNTIGGAGPMTCNPEAKSIAEDSDQVSLDSKNPLALISLENPLPFADTQSNEENHQNQATSVLDSSVNHQYPLHVKPLNSCASSDLFDCYFTPHDMNISSSEEATKSEEAPQTSPRKKRKKAPENEGHKGCNCKRSKCLKLYCDCFAAGGLCSEACACIDCLNRHEYEDTVRGARQQIESRNPLAFAPKVVLRASDPPKDTGERKHITPTSGRHKRGCNCKKSQCLKKYCECYQAGVGCSLGCRCEGCKNSHGSKDECAEIVIEHKRHKEEGCERDLSCEESIQAKRELARPKQSHSHFSPPTPLVQMSIGNNAPKAQFPASYYPSPESAVSLLTSHSDSPSSAMDSIHNKVFSHRWEGFADFRNGTPLLKSSTCAGLASAASRTRELKSLQGKSFQRNVLPDSCSLDRSPATPIPQPGESKFVREPASDSGTHCNLEDDTPAILNDTRSAIKAVKATSPNSKRVTPPHQVLSETRSNSPGLRSGRKFILRSVSAFPPLTPYKNNTPGDGT